MNFSIAQQLTLIAPLVVVSLGAIIVMLGEVFLSKDWPRAQFTSLILTLAFITIFYAHGSIGYNYGTYLFSGLLLVDPYAAVISALIILSAILAQMIGVGSQDRDGIEHQGEFYSLYLIAIGGALALVYSAEYITLFVALETMSLALYCLCGSCLSVKRSMESSLKYFLLGAFSSAIMLYGIALYYGSTQSTFFNAELLHYNKGAATVYVTAMGLILVGILFKVGAVPFHFWTPDVYEGAPNAVTSFMASTIKIASVAVAIRVMWSCFGSSFIFWSTAVWYCAVLTIIAGNLIALRQRSVKRMLAYSSISNAGYMLMGLLSTNDKFGGAAALTFYLAVYSVLTLGSLACLHVIAGEFYSKESPDDLNRFNGLGYSRPIIAACFSLFLLGLAGLPPGMAGMVGKLYLFSAAIKAEYVGLAIIGVLGSAISCYYYLYVIVRMYFVDGENKLGSKVSYGLPIYLVIGICAVLSVFMGLFPSPLYNLSESAVMISQLLR